MSACERCVELTRELREISDELQERVADYQEMGARCAEAMAERDEALAGFATGRREAAEAMREATMQTLRDAFTTGLMTPAQLTQALRVIARLPLPGDAP